MQEQGQHASTHRALDGVAASPGVALGPAFVYGALALTVPPTPRQAKHSPSEEKAALRTALEGATAQLLELGAQVSQQISQAEGGIFEAQAMLLQDTSLTERANQLLDAQGHSAAEAITQAVEEQARELEALDNAVIAGRSADLRDALQRVLHLLAGTQAQSLVSQLAAAGTPVILVARDLLPSQTAGLRAAHVLGICTAIGGSTAHAAILARALGIPAVMGLGEELLAQVQPGMELGLNGSQGKLILTPDAALRQHLLAQMQQQRAQTQQRLGQAARWRNAPGATADGHRVLIAANIGGGGPAEAQEARERWGAEGVGLLRTEFLFGDRATLPDEAEQTEQYRALFHAFASHAPAGAPLVVRTLDAGADKPLPALAALLGDAPEANPALGLRGIRIHLAFPDLLRTQVRALLNAAGASGINLHLMFPMIATVQELRWARALFEETRAALVRAGVQVPLQVPVGIMVEVPSELV
jgi:phosphoenolpyruvate-protein kinase (PTS system EI component)